MCKGLMIQPSNASDVSWYIACSRPGAPQQAGRKQPPPGNNWLVEVLHVVPRVILVHFIVASKVLLIVITVIIY